MSTTTKSITSAQLTARKTAKVAKSAPVFADSIPAKMKTAKKVKAPKKVGTKLTCNVINLAIEAKYPDTTLRLAGYNRKIWVTDTKHSGSELKVFETKTFNGKSLEQWVSEVIETIPAK